MRAWVTSALCGALLVGALAGAPAHAAPVGPLGEPPITLGTTSTSAGRPQLAALPDGTVLAAWLALTGTDLQVRVRPAGSSTWGGVLTLPLEAGWSGYPEVLSLVKPLMLAPAGPSAFLLVWQETKAGDERIRALRLSRAGAAVGGQVTLAGPGSVNPTSVATNASGRAAVTYLSEVVGGITAHVTVRDTESGGWRAPVTLSTISSPSMVWGLMSGVAVHDSGTVCAAFPISVSGSPVATVPVSSRCAAPAALASAADQSVGNFAADGFSGLLAAPLSVTATAQGFLLAGQVAGTGTVPWPLLSVPAPTRVQVRTRPSGSGAWSGATTFGLPGELNVGPTALASSTGVAVHFRRLRGAVGSTSAQSSFTLDQRVAQRQGSGEWTPVRSAASFATTNLYLGLLGGPSLGPAGEMLVPTPTPTSPSGWTSGYVRRSGWTGDFSPAGGLGVALTTDSVIVASGRATALGLLDPSGSVVVAQTALPTPFVRAAAKIPSAPKAGTASSCSFAFTDAASATRQWRVNGVVRGSSSTYTPSSSDRGKTLTCRVTGTNPTGSTVTTSPGRVVT